MKKLISNPNFIYIAAFIVPFLFYTLGWSHLYPAIGTSLIVFYLITFLICAIFGAVIHYVKPFCYNSVPISKWNHLIIFSIYIFYFIEALYSRKIPLIGLIAGTYSYDEDTFGIPAFHTFVDSFDTFYCVYLFHQYLSSKKRALLFLCFVCLFPFIILVYRANILNVLLGCFTVFLLSRNTISVKIIAKSIVGIIIILYLFGFMGNIRSAHGDSTVVPRASEATEEFMNGPVPNEFYWSYLYIASPVANLQNNIHYTTKPNGDVFGFVMHECIPNYVIKLLQMPGIEFYQINPFLNVGTIYVYSYSYLGWAGVAFLFTYFIVLINLYYFALQQTKTYKVAGMAMLFNVIIFANFHNTIAYAGSSTQLFYPIIFSIVTEKFIRKNKAKKIQVSTLATKVA
jgi:oligosaccharide repeat unit polymerase